MVTGSLCDKFPLRNIVVVGAVIAAVGFAISAFATNIYLVIFGYGILAGKSVVNILKRVGGVSCILNVIF